MVDIKETKELLGWALDTALRGKEVFANGEFGLEDIGNLFLIIRGAPGAFVGADQVITEFWDWDAAEQAELAALVAEKLAPWGLSEHEIERITDDALKALIADAVLVRDIIALKKSGDEKNATKDNEPQ